MQRVHCIVESYAQIFCYARVGWRACTVVLLRVIVHVHGSQGPLCVDDEFCIDWYEDSTDCIRETVAVPLYY